MTKLTYEQLKNTDQYRVVQKLFYKRYPIAVRFFRSENSLIDFSAYQKIREIKRWLKVNNSFDYRTRIDYGLSIYLPDMESLSRVFNRYRYEIEFIDAPLSDKHHDVMVNDLTIVVRKKLYYNTYRYKVSSNLWRNDMVKWNDMITLCQDSFDQTDYKLNNILSFYLNYKDDINATTQNGLLWPYRPRLPYNATGTIYLKNYDDVCTLHLICKPIITSTSKVTLISELE
jgi:hypothetical protein